MSSAELHAYCPSAASLGRARLDGWNLAFTTFSERRQGGVADIVPAWDQHVWGVLWTIPQDELPALHKKEGYDPAQPKEQNFYVPVELTVLLDGKESQPQEAYAYIVASKVAAHIPPHPAYLEIIKRGAVEHRIDLGLISAILAAGTIG
jgi:hypothetical protein